MINRHAPAGLLTTLFMQQDGTVELLPKPPYLRLAKRDVETIKQYLTLRENPSRTVSTQDDYEAFQSQIENSEKREFRQIRLRPNDLICHRKNAHEVVYLRVLFDDFQPRKNYRSGQRARQNRDFLRTYAGLTEYYQRTQSKTVRPILGVLRDVRSEINVYVPSSSMRFSEQLFDEFFPSIKYQDVDAYLRELGDDPAIVQIFDDLYQKIRYGSLGKQLPEANPV